MPHAIVYCRVSTEDQKLENQLPALIELATRAGYAYEVRTEKAGATKHRPVWESCLASARAGQCQAVIVWALDRMGRSMSGILATVADLDTRGVKVLSVQESWLSQEGPQRILLIAVLGWVAQMERERIRERTRAGLATARLAGVRLGRQPTVLDLATARSMRAQGASMRAVAARLGVGVATLSRRLQIGT